MPKAIPEKTYDFKAVEDKLYQAWQNAGCFTPEIEPDKQPYTIVIPPPNITGQLHMGHALDETLQDILIRTKRMQGIPALWLPGTDPVSYTHLDVYKRQPWYIPKPWLGCAQWRCRQSVPWHAALLGCGW